MQSNDPKNIDNNLNGRVNQAKINLANLLNKDKAVIKGVNSQEKETYVNNDAKTEINTALKDIGFHNINHSYLV